MKVNEIIVEVDMAGIGNRIANTVSNAATSAKVAISSKIFPQPPVLPGFELVYPKQILKKVAKYTAYRKQAKTMADYAYINQWSKNFEVLAAKDPILNNPNIPSTQYNKPIQDLLIKYLIRLYAFPTYKGETQNSNARKGSVETYIFNKYRNSLSNKATQRLVIQMWIYYSLLDRDNMTSIKNAALMIGKGP